MTDRLTVAAAIYVELLRSDEKARIPRKPSLMKQALADADQFISLEQESRVKCQHPPGRRAFTEHYPERTGPIKFGGPPVHPSRKTWCLDCGKEIKP